MMSAVNSLSPLRTAGDSKTKRRHTRRPRQKVVREGKKNSVLLGICELRAWASAFTVAAIVGLTVSQLVRLEAPTCLLDEHRGNTETFLRPVVTTGPTTFSRYTHWYSSIAIGICSPFVEHSRSVAVILNIVAAAKIVHKFRV